MFALAVPAYISQTISSSRGTWPIAQCRVELGAGPGRRVMIRCSLSMPGRRSMPGSPSTSRSTSLISKDFLRSAWSSMIQNHRTWGEKSLQTLQRVGTLLRSTSKDCIAALGTKKESAIRQEPSPAQPSVSDPATVGQVKASLSKFLATADDAELQQAAMLSDLSNMVYDVHLIDGQQLQRYNLAMVARSRSPAAVAQEAQAELAPRQPCLAAVAIVVEHPHADTAADRLAARSRPAAAVSTVWDAAPQYQSNPRPGTPQSPRSYFAGSTSPSTSPRTPFILSSFSEYDDLGCEQQLAATASGAVIDSDTPRRCPSASAAMPLAARAADSDWAGAAADVAERPGYDGSCSMSRSGSADVALEAQLMHYQQDQLEAVQQQKYVTLQEQEQQTSVQLQQQAQAVLLEMQQQQQLQMLLQQEQAIMQQLAVRSGSGSGDGCTPSRNTAWWWWQQQQQQQQAAAVANAAANSASSSCSSTTAEGAEFHPTDWFVCDEASSSQSDSPIRYIVIQGSITLDHWRINLTIDPCELEGGGLGHVKVHRGVYETALEMLDTFVPYVQEHLAQHPNGKIAFAGHSLGGSLATLLMVIMVHRGILPASNVATVRTFGAPAIFCEGATGSPPAAGSCHSCSLPCEHREQQSAASAAATAAGHGAMQGQESHGLLAKLGLSHTSVVNVVMTRDIVPRAFVCDYTLVADFMRSWLPGFKEHMGLASCKEHKALYNFAGTVEVLQPSAECPFVLPDETHSMLPDHPALYKLTDPTWQLDDAWLATLEGSDCPASPPVALSGACYSVQSDLTALAAAAGALASVALAATATAADAELQPIDAVTPDHVAEDAAAGAAAAVAAACGSCIRGSCGGCRSLQDDVLAGADELIMTAGSMADSVAALGRERVADLEQQQQDMGSLAASADILDSGSGGKKSKLGGFGSWGSLVTLGHLSLTAAVADLASTFTLVSSNSSMVTVQVGSKEGAIADSDSNCCSSAADPAVIDCSHAAVLGSVGAAKQGEPAVSAAQASIAATSADASDLLDLTLGDAILTFMNSPHPLEMLSDLRSYGPSGTISRFHNPNNYTIALQHLCTTTGAKV